MALNVKLFLVGAAASVSTPQPTAQAPQPRQLTYRVEFRIDATRDNLVPIGGIRIGPRKQILFPQAQDRRFLLYDSLGRRLAVLGRAGDGPGEFRTVGSTFGWKGDSIWTYDPSHERFTIFRPNGTYARSVVPEQLAATLGPPAAPYSRINPDPILAAYSDGMFLARGSVDARAPESLRQQCGEGCFVISDSTERVHSVAARQPPDESGSFTETMRGSGAPDQLLGFSLAVPFAHRIMDRASADGQLIVYVTTTRAPRGQFRVIAMRASGDTVFSSLVPYTPEPIPARTIDSAVTSTLERVRGRGFPAGLLLQYQNGARSRAPDVYQPYRGVAIGKDHSVWITLRSPATELRWIRLDNQGRVVNSLLVPRNIALGEFDGFDAWAVESDANDLQSIVKLKLIER